MINGSNSHRPLFETTAFDPFAYPLAYTPRSAFKGRLGKKVPDRLYPTAARALTN